MEFHCQYAQEAIKARQPLVQKVTLYPPWVIHTVKHVEASTCYKAEERRMSMRWCSSYFHRTLTFFSYFPSYFPLKVKTETSTIPASWNHNLKLRLLCGIPAGFYCHLSAITLYPAHQYTARKKLVFPGLAWSSDYYQLMQCYSSELTQQFPSAHAPMRSLCPLFCSGLGKAIQRLRRQSTAGS